MKKLLVIMFGIILLVCSFLVIPNSSMASSYSTTPEILQNRIDYSLKVIWDLQAKYRSSNFNELMFRMNQRDKQIYLAALKLYNRAKMEYNAYIVKMINSKYRTSNYNQLMSMMSSLDRQIYINALKDFKKAQSNYNFLLQNRF